jgi:hypothetical protein
MRRQSVSNANSNDGNNSNNRNKQQTSKIDLEFSIDNT